MRKNLIAIVLSAALLLVACDGDKGKTDKPVNNNEPSTSQPAKELEKPKFTKENFPKIDGSTATIPFSEALVSDILGMSKEDAQKFVKHNTTHVAYMNLIGRKADIIFVTEPSEDELNSAKKANVELEVVPIVREGFVFLVNTKNPVKSLTTQQIQDIYQGKIRNWKEVGGADKEIKAYQRDKNSGSQTLMEQTVMKGLKMLDSPKDVVQDMSGLIDRVANYDNAENALGYSVYYYAKSMYNKDTIKLIAVNGVEPTTENISSQKYPFTSAYYAVIRKSDAANADSRTLLKWILSRDGQELAEKAGYAPLQVR